jgi:hypothetical protein
MTRISPADGGLLGLTKEIEIIAEKEDRSKITLFKGEITALEPSYKEGMILEVVVRGFDKSHRLFRQTQSKAYLNIKDSDLASRLAGDAGLSAQVDATSAVYDHIFQHNQTNLELLFHASGALATSAFPQMKLYFRKPPAISPDFSKWGDDSFEFYLFLFGRAGDQVVVKGWDPA